MRHGRIATVLAAGWLVGVGSIAAGEPDKVSVQAKDFAGREWTLDDTWKEGDRPYEKELTKREAAYRKRWGEDWGGQVGDMGSGRGVIYSPGVWKFEEFGIIPDARRAQPYQKIPGGHDQPSGGSGYAMIVAPGAGEVTDIYVAMLMGIYHVDAKTKAITFIGDEALLDEVKEMAPADCNDRWKNLTLEGNGPVPVYLKPLPAPRDGLENRARLVALRGGTEGTVDPISGRVYFAEPVGRRGAEAFGPSVLRYVEKLLPYREKDTELLLPAILDFNELYKKVAGPGGGALAPVMKDDRRAGPRFAVRTTSITNFRGPALMGGGGWGRKVCLSIDGKRVYAERDGKIVPVEIDTGKALAAVPVGPLPAGWSKNYHGGACALWDGFFYNSCGQGSGPNPGVLIGVNLADGKVSALYNSDNPALADARREAVSRCNLWDGPADAVSLFFSSSNYQFQSPRTGAVFNGGWDGSGTRRYHDGFVTTLGGSTFGPGRPEWKDATMPQAAFGHLQQSLAVAPAGDMYYASKHHPGNRYSRQYPDWLKNDRKQLVLARDGVRIMHIWRTDWPAEQPVNGYANQFCSQERREALMFDYAKNYVAHYAELSKIYDD